MAGAKLRADQLVGVVALGFPDPACLDRLTPGGTATDRRDAKVSIRGQGQRARYGRRRHVQQVRSRVAARIGCSVGQRLPLLHAEPVLLVHDDQPQSGKRLALEEQGLGADRDRRGPRAKGEPSMITLPGCQATGHQHRRDAGGRKQHVERPQMLVGERLGRDEEGGLAPGFDRLTDRQRRHHGLARPDFALQQSPHRPVTLEVTCDLGSHALLLGGERERQFAHDRRAQAGVTAQRRRRPSELLIAPDGAQAELQDHEFLQHQSPPPQAPFACRSGKMDGGECVGLVGNVQSPTHPGRQVLDRRAQVGTCGVDQLTQPARRQGFTRRVDGHEPLGVASLRALPA